MNRRGRPPDPSGGPACRVEAEGPLAAFALADGALRVIAVFARTVYAESPGGKLLCLAHTDLPPGPFTLACTPWEAVLTAGIREGDAFTADNAGLQGPGGLRICRDAAASPVPSVSALSASPGFPAIDLRRMAAGLARTAGLCALLHPSGALAPLLPPAAGVERYPSRRSPRTLEEALLEAVREGLDSLSAWLREGRPADLAAALDSLLGLGQGLTPSGDDMTGGFLLALRLLGDTARHDMAAREALRRAPDRTNRISLAYLRAAAQGHASSVLHEALNALCRNAPELPDVLRGLDRMGHSSGWDALLGSLPVFAAALNRITPPRN